MLAGFLRSIVIVLALAPGGERRSINFTEDSLEVVQKNVAKKKAVLVDVRSQDEWDKGHIEGSLWVPVTSLRKHSLDPEKLAKKLPKKGKAILYTFCVVGMRAKQAGLVLQQQGYEVRVLKPGYEELLEAGFKNAEVKQDEEKMRGDSPVPDEAYCEFSRGYPPEGGLRRTVQGVRMRQSFGAVKPSRPSS